MRCGSDLSVSLLLLKQHFAPGHLFPFGRGFFVLQTAFTAVASETVWPLSLQPQPSTLTGAGGPLRARPSSIAAPSQPLTGEPITKGDGMCGICEAEANKELPIRIAAATSVMIDATLLVKGEDVADFTIGKSRRQGQLNNVRVEPLVARAVDGPFPRITKAAWFSRSPGAQPHHGRSFHKSGGTDIFRCNGHVHANLLPSAFRFEGACDAIAEA